MPFRMSLHPDIGVLRYTTNQWAPCMTSNDTFQRSKRHFKPPALSRPRNRSHRRDRDPGQMPATVAMLLRVKHSKVAPPLLGLPCRCGWHGVLLASLQQDVKRLGALAFFSRSWIGYPGSTFMSGFMLSFVLSFVITDTHLGPPCVI